MKYIFLTLFLFVVYKGAAQQRQLTVASYNLRYDNAEDITNGNGWKQRLPAIATLIRFHGFDVFGTQEGLVHQLGDLKKELPGYEYIGVGRDDGVEKGEYAAIFYNAAKFKLLDKGDFWMAPDMSKPGKGWDAVLPRICSWGLFQERKTGFIFYCFNLHMDHMGVQARNESAKLVLEVIRKKAGKTAAILMGDFNADQREKPYQLLQASDLLEDAFTLSPVKLAPSGTFNGFESGRCSDSRIDHIFLTKAFSVSRYGILNNTYNLCTSGTYSDQTSRSQVQKFPSDHFPVMVSLAY